MIFRRRKTVSLTDFTDAERITVGAAVGLDIASVMPVPNEELIERFKAAIDGDPDDWLLQYWLGHAYFNMGQFANAKRTVDRMLELAPEEPRAIYAAASIYRTLSQAWMVATPEAEMQYYLALRQMRRAGIDHDGLDAKGSRAALAELDMSYNEAFSIAIRLFERIGKYPLNRVDRRILDETLASVRSEQRNAPRPR